MSDAEALDDLGGATLRIDVAGADWAKLRVEVYPSPGGGRTTPKVALSTGNHEARGGYDSIATLDAREALRLADALVTAAYWCGARSGPVLAAECARLRAVADAARMYVAARDAYADAHDRCPDLASGAARDAARLPALEHAADTAYVALVAALGAVYGGEVVP
jgi:hypothetical protein